MSAAAVSRAVLRRQQARGPAMRQQVRRYAEGGSNGPSTTEKAKEAANKATSKASEGLTRVTSTAGPALSKAASGVGSAVNSVGGRIGRLIAFGQSLVPPTIYYSKVGFELSKIIYQGQRMSMPSMSNFQNTFSGLVRQARNPSQLTAQASHAVESGAQQAIASPANLVSRLRNFDRATLARGGVLTAEILGFFTVGEMVGRLKIIGYRGDAHAHH